MVTVVAIDVATHSNLCRIYLMVICGHCDGQSVITEVSFSVYCVISHSGHYDGQWRCSLWLAVMVTIMVILKVTCSVHYCGHL